MSEPIQITNLQREYLRNCMRAIERADIEISQAMPDMERLQKLILEAMSYYRLAFGHG